MPRRRKPSGRPLLGSFHAECRIAPPFAAISVSGDTSGRTPCTVATRAQLWYLSGGRHTVGTRKRNMTLLRRQLRLTNSGKLLSPVMMWGMGNFDFEGPCSNVECGFKLDRYQSMAFSRNYPVTKELGVFRKRTALKAPHDASQSLMCPCNASDTRLKDDVTV